MAKATSSFLFVQVLLLDRPVGNMSSHTTLTLQILKENKPVPSLKGNQKLGKKLNIKFDICICISWTLVLWIRYLVVLHFWSIFPICFHFIFQKEKAKISMCMNSNWFERQFRSKQKLGLKPFLKNVFFLNLIKGEDPYTKPLEQWVNTFYVLLTKWCNKKQKYKLNVDKVFL